jgi:5-methylcytosine-specific restriction endonuclease McrBC GTP-binding regulatory subunit McrB
MENIIAKYKDHIRQTVLKDELYKWRLIQQFKGRPDLNAVNFGEDIFQINYYNLLYKLSKGVLNDIANNRPEELRKCFIALFNENHDLKDRIRQFSDDTLEIYREWVEKYYHHQDERSISTYLTFYNPDKYTLYKYTFYKKFCENIGIKTKGKWERYIHYLELIKDFKDKYIDTDLELIQLVDDLKTEDCYADKNHLILAQDILYQMLEKLVVISPNYWAAGFHWKDENGMEINKLNEFINNGIWQIGWQRDQMEGDPYYKLIDKALEGDYILLKTYSGKHDLTVFGLGRVTDTSNANDGILEVEWTIKNETYKGKAPSGAGAGAGNWQGTFLQVKRSEDINLLFNQAIVENEKSILRSKSQTYPLNQILYGPPGTGKTYNSINHAVAIIEGRKVEDIDKESQINRKEVLDRFRQYREMGQIVFTTFHQSMCYEDFIEGIKPQEPAKEGDQITYKVEDGIFKRLCAKAGTKDLITASNDFSKIRFYKMSLGGKRKPAIHDWCIQNNKIAIGWGNEYNFEQYLSIKEWIQFRDRFSKDHPDLVEESRFHIQAIYVFQKMKVGDIVVITKGNSEIDAIGEITSEYYWNDNNPTEYFHFRDVKWLAKNLQEDPSTFFKKNISQQSIYEFYDEDVKRDAFESYFSQSSVNHQPYVLIIDEINRGNVSQIFGELITLIEEDKRLGKKEELTVTLPYSKKKGFGVPSNLYIVGTMNTADRSVEALDSALRRRFTFIEMNSKPELIKDFGVIKGFTPDELIYPEALDDLVKVLEVINARIEKLLDKDHTIGHSYFMSVSTIEDLKCVFMNKIIPLLQEYFYGDIAKIGLVLGVDFFEPIEINKNIFADFPHDDKSDLSDRKVYRLKKEWNDEEFITAVKKIIGK